MAPYAETGTVTRRTPVIDPETQIAVVVDEHGRSVELNDYNNQTSSSTSSHTGTSSGDSHDSDDSHDDDHD
ncbi:putative ATP-grasp-modified RiPP [Streptomyces boluensis]